MSNKYLIPPFPHSRTPGHTGEVSSVDWCPRDPHLLVTASDDNSVRVWRVNRRGGVAPEPGIVSGVAKREPVTRPDFSLAPRTPGGSSVGAGALSPFPRTPTTPRCSTNMTPSSRLQQTPKSSTLHQKITRTPGSGSSMGFTPKTASQSHHQQPKTPTSRDFYSPTKTPQSPLRSHASQVSVSCSSCLCQFVCLSLSVSIQDSSY